MIAFFVYLQKLQLFSMVDNYILQHQQLKYYSKDCKHNTMVNEDKVFKIIIVHFERI